MKKWMSMVGAALLLGVALVFGLPGMEAKAADIPFIVANGRDALEQPPTEQNNCQMVVTLKYPAQVNGYYRQAVKVVLRNVNTNQAVGYYDEHYIKATNGTATTAAPVGSWRITTRFSNPPAGTYVVELYTMSSPTQAKLFYTSDRFEVKGSHNHNMGWMTTELGSTSRDKHENYQCMGCGFYTGDNRNTSSFAIFLQEAYLRMDATPQNGTLVLESATFNSYPKAFMQQLAKRRDITTVLYVPYQGNTYKVTIPADVVVNVDYDYYGPLLLNALYGAEIVPYNPQTVASSNLNAVMMAAKGDVVVLSGRDTYTKNDMLTIASRRDITVVIKCTYAGVNYVITIPAGAQIDTSVDFYGPLKLASLYPYTIATQ